MTAAPPGPGSAEPELAAPLPAGPLPASLEDERSDRGDTRARAVGQGALTLLGLGAGLLALRTVGVHGPACPFRAATGVPCPGCGMTRLADAVAHGRIGDAVGHDPAGVAILGVIVVLATTYLVRVVIQKRDAPRWLGSPILIAGVVALAAGHWIVTLVNGGLPAS
ncbi:MAG: hypothetical protein JWO77_2896 [Ilumatobacteraceae bacterium]|nr:hypothetical protein [Ilumatobacteraceae bacterium]